MLIVTDGRDLFVITGAGDVLEPEHDVTAIGSGGNYALAAARALYDQDLDAEAIARRAMAIAAEICVYTNGNLTVESLDAREIGFRPVTAADRPLLAGWIARPHWARWWGTGRGGGGVIRTSPRARRVTSDRSSSRLDGRDAGYIQAGGGRSASWRDPGRGAAGHDAAASTCRSPIPPTAAAASAPRVLSAFIDRLAAEGVTRFLIDPAPDNLAARRAYGKAGFVEAARGTHMDGPYVLMVLDLQPAEAE